MGHHLDVTGGVDGVDGAVVDVDGLGVDEEGEDVVEQEQQQELQMKVEDVCLDAMRWEARAGNKNGKDVMGDGRRRAGRRTRNV